MKLKIDRIRFHRNGCCGAPFHVVEFRHRLKGERRERRFIATVFEENGVCAVVQPDNTLNCWRGDHFEDALRAAITARSDDDSVFSYEGTDN